MIGFYILILGNFLKVSSRLFAANSKEQNIEPENNKLLRCRECHVTVHASCYGVTVNSNDSQSWACDKCKSGKSQLVRHLTNIMN